MANIVSGLPISLEAVPGKKSGHTEPQSPMFSLNDRGHKVRIANFQWFMGQMSHSAFEARRKKGLIPPPDGHDKRPFWWSETVAHYLKHLTRRRWQRFPARRL
jgi:hypothetical protein